MAAATSKTERAAEKFAWLEAVALDPRCTILMIRVATVLSAMSNDKGEAWPSYDTLAFIAGAARTNIMKAIDRLWEANYLLVEKDDQPGRSRVNRYRLLPPSDLQPVWSRYDAWKDEKGSRGDDRSFRAKGSSPRSKESSNRLPKGHAGMTRSLEHTPDKKPSSASNEAGADGAVVIRLRREVEG